MGGDTSRFGPMESHQSPTSNGTADIWFYWDPVCPFAWITSRWINEVKKQRDYEVDWRFISLRVLNKHVDYDSHFPPEYEVGHTAGLRMLRVAAAIRAEHGRSKMGELYDAFGAAVFDRPRSENEADARQQLGTVDFIAEILADIGMDPLWAEQADNTTWDEVITAETEEALALCGKDVGTPIIAYDPPDGVAFFGPVISRVPAPEEAVELWDAVVKLARFQGFAELKRSLRERPQLRAFGVEPGEVGQTEDWHGGSRRQKK